MRKKILLTSAFIAAFLFGRPGLLSARNLTPQRGQASPSGDAGQEGDENSADQDGEDGKNVPGGNQGPTPGQDERGAGGSGTDEGREDSGEYGEPGKGPGGGEGGGEGNGGNRPAARKASYKDSIARAAKYTAKKQYASASREYNKALTVLSDDDSRKVFVYERQGWLALMGSDITGAEGFYLAAIYQAEKIETFDKSAVNAYRGAAYCYEKDGEISSAVENYQLALKHAADKATKADIRKKIQRLQAAKKKKNR